MEIQNLIRAFLIFLSFGTIIAIFWILRRNNHDVKTLKDLFKPPKPRLHYVTDMKKLRKLNHELHGLSIEEKLILFRAFFGSSYKAMIYVTGNGIQIEGTGSHLDDSDEEREDITG